jgi:hypothetical protein
METKNIHEAAPVNVKTGCICPNQHRPIDGVIRTAPSCRIHYAEANIPTRAEEPPIAEEEIGDWRKPEKQEKKRVSYPKMTVARK